MIHTGFPPSATEALLWLRRAVRRDRPALMLAAFRPPAPKPLPGTPPTPRPLAATAPLSREGA